MHLLVQATQPKRRNHNLSSVSITITNITKIGRFSVNPVILSTQVEKMLGVHISKDLSFVLHLILQKASVLAKLKKRLNALKQLRRVSSFKSRLTEAARVVTGRNWQPGGGPSRVKTSELLQQCGWMSVHQLGVHTSVMEVHRILQNKQPQYLYEKLTARTWAQGVHRTRQNYQVVE